MPTASLLVALNLPPTAAARAARRARRSAVHRGARQDARTTHMDDPRYGNMEANIHCSSAEAVKRLDGKKAAGATFSFESAGYCCPTDTCSWLQTIMQGAQENCINLLVMSMD